MPCCGLGRPVDLLGKALPDHRAVNCEILLVALIPSQSLDVCQTSDIHLGNCDVRPIHYIRTSECHRPALSWLGGDKRRDLHFANVPDAAK
jgi:hypothetical protein